MSQRFWHPFQPVSSTAPSFNSTLGSATTIYALESTALNRVWQGPSARTVRAASKAADDYSLSFGTSDTTAVSTGDMLILGGVTETFHVQPGWTHVAVASSTDVTANFTIGYGG